MAGADSRRTDDSAPFETFTVARTRAGVSAGIDMSFAIVEQVCGRVVALETAHYIEYPWGKHDVPKHQNAL